MRARTIFPLKCLIVLVLAAGVGILLATVTIEAAAAPLAEAFDNAWVP